MPGERTEVDIEALALFAAELRRERQGFFDEYRVAAEYKTAADPAVAGSAAPGLREARLEFVQKLDARLSRIHDHSKWIERMANAAEKMSEIYAHTDAAAAERLADLEGLLYVPPPADQSNTDPGR